MLNSSPRNVKPAVFIDAPSAFIVCHLTEGFDPAIAQKDGEPVAFAWTAEGKVKATGGAADFKGFRFGFHQFAKFRGCICFNVGRTPLDGVSEVTVDEPRAMAGGKLFLDSIKRVFPWTFDAPPLPPKSDLVSAETGDHVTAKMGTDVFNQRTRAKNFLQKVLWGLELFTVFDVQGADGKLEHLANFHWFLKYKFDFFWVLGDASKGTKDRIGVAADDSRFTMGPVSKGAPPDPDLQQLLENPSGTTANDAINKARSVAFLLPPNRVDRPLWDRVIPADVFR